MTNVNLQNCASRIDAPAEFFDKTIGFGAMMP